MDRRKAVFGLQLLSTKHFPWLGFGISHIFGAKLAELVYLLAVVRDAVVEFFYTLRCGLALGDDISVCATGSTGGREKRFAFGPHAIDDIVALTARDLADGLIECLAQMVGRVAH